ncbi:MAG: SH3 domain-containing protein [Spirochaetes bacterium]|nr:SH3 domain-containing protein [Spirochaetota bacterium]
MKSNKKVLLLPLFLLSALCVLGAAGDRYFATSAENLRFRETPGTAGKFMRYLVAGEKLKFLEKGKEETIGGVRGAWCKFQTEKGETGWCFDGFLTEIISTVTTPPAHAKAVFSVSFSPDGKFALSASADKTIKLWEIPACKEVRTFTGHTGSVNAVVYSQEGHEALSGSADMTMKMWDIATGKDIKTFKCLGSVDAVAISPVYSTVLGGGGRVMIQQFGRTSGMELTYLSGHTSFPLSIVYSPDGKYALSGSWDTSIKLWDAESSKEIRTLQGHRLYVRSVAFSPNGKQILSGGEDGALILWDTGSGRKIRSFIEDTFRPPIHSVAVSPNGKYAASGFYGGSIKLWELSTGKEVRTFDGHTDIVKSMVFSPDGKYLLSGSFDKTIKLWEVSTGRCVRSF